MSEEYIPTTDEVRGAYAEGTYDIVSSEERTGRKAEFDRWLAQCGQEMIVSTLRALSTRLYNLRDAALAGDPAEWETFKENPQGWLLDQADMIEAGNA